MAVAPRDPMLPVYALVVLYALCYQLQSPLEPFLVASLSKQTGDAAQQSYARLQSFFAAIQLGGSLLVGYLLDIFGLRVMFALNFVGCAASYGLLASADSLEMLWLSKVPTVFMAGFLCAQGAAAKLTPAGDARASALGRLTSAYTLGGVVGPSLGGYLGTQLASKLAVAGSCVAVMLVFLLPKAVEAGGAATPTAASKSASDGPTIAPLARMKVILSLTWPLLLTKLCSGLVNSATGAARPILLKDDFGLGAGPPRDRLLVPAACPPRDRLVTAS